MIVLSATTSTLQVVLDASPTNQLPCSTSYADQGGNAATTDVNTNGTTAVTIVPAPASGVNRVVNSVSIYNADTATRTVTVNKNDNGTLYTQIKVALPSGYRLGYNAARGWGVTDASGNFLETVQANQAGTWTVNIGSSLPAGSNAIGSVTVSNTVAVSGTFWQTTQPVSLATLPALTAGSAVIGAVTQSGSWTVTANAGTGTFTVSDTNFVSQGSTTAGQKGLLAQGAVTTSAPSYTTAQTSPLSLTTSGALRTDASATTQPVSGTVTANQGGSNWSINLAQVGGSSVSLGQKASASSIPVVVASDQSILTVQGAANQIQLLSLNSTTAANWGSGSSYIRSLAVICAGASVSGGLVNLTIKDGGGTQRVMLTLPVPTSGSTFFPMFDCEDLAIPMVNGGGTPTMQLSLATLSGYIGVVVSFE